MYIYKPVTIWVTQSEPAALTLDLTVNIRDSGVILDKLNHLSVLTHI